MSSKPVRVRRRAEQDIDEVVEYYLTQGAPKAAAGFIDELERVFRRLGHPPSSGSLRYAHILSLPGLRFYGLKRYPQLVFYVERDEHVEVWRVLHGRRDLGMVLSEAD